MSENGLRGLQSLESPYDTNHAILLDFTSGLFQTPPSRARRLSTPAAAGLFCESLGVEATSQAAGHVFPANLLAHFHGSFSDLFSGKENVCPHTEPIPFLGVGRPPR